MPQVQNTAKAKSLNVQLPQPSTSSAAVPPEIAQLIAQNPKKAILPQINQPLVIVASGPSLSDQQLNLVERSQLKVLVINDNYLRAPWADYFYAADIKWLKWHIEELKKFKGRKFTQTNLSSKQQYQETLDFAIKHDLETIDSRANMCLSTDPSVIHQGLNSGYQAINLAYHMKATKVILIGYDMQFTDNKAHWFGDHPDKIRSDYGSFNFMFSTMSEHAKNLNFEIINCTEQTALTCFPRKKLIDVLTE